MSNGGSHVRGHVVSRQSDLRRYAELRSQELFILRFRLVQCQVSRLVWLVDWVLYSVRAFKKIGLAPVYLPSTSPANCKMSQQELVSAYMVVANAII